MKSKFLKLTLTLSISIGLLYIFSYPAMGTTNEMKVHYINVGQGDSIYIKTAAGEDVLIDGGDKDGSDVVAYLKSQKVGDIEVMILTHPDEDHVGGLDEVLKAYKVKSIYAPKVSHTTQAYKDFLLAVKQEGVAIKTAQKGVTIPLKGTITSFVGPVKTYNDLNDSSAVIRLAYGTQSFLFTGDAEFKSETDMINSKQNLTANVLKLGHHGAKTSTSESFLKSVKPQFAIISVGKNSYGHPTQETLNRLKAAKVNVFRTDKQGSIIATTNGKTLSFNAKPTAPVSVTVPTVVPATYKLTATLSTTTPKQYTNITLNTKDLPAGTPYKAVFHYKTTKTTYNGKVGTPMSVKIGNASKSFRVNVDVTSTYKGKNYTAKTSFLPK